MKKKLLASLSLAAVGCICLLGQPFVTTNYTQLVFPPRMNIRDQVSELERAVNINMEESFKLGVLISWTKMRLDPSYITNGPALIEACCQWRTNVIRGL